MIRNRLLVSALSFCVAFGAACSSNGAGGGPLFTTRQSTIAPTSIELPTTSSEPTTTIETTTTTTLPQTVTTLPLELAGGVVKVANATEVEEAAQQLTNELAGVGFAVAEATNSAGKDEELSTSKIYVKAGSEAVAQSVAYLMGGIEVLRMPTPAWIFGGTAALGDTTVLVMLGSDLAGSPLLVMRFEPGRQGPD
ncbi:MAG: LytR C-terminal domain-containing protein [Actinomycetia bacterium]|nr:LytR C-terminal domain-containing protein [Actinomycetes bacterium]